MSKIVATGKTVEDAVEQGLAQWGVSRDHVSVQILSQPSKGFLGLFGVKEAKVELTLLSSSAGGDELKRDFSSEKQAAPALEIQKTPAEPKKTAAVSSLSEDKTVYAEKHSEEDPYQEAISFLMETGKAMGLDITVDVEHGKEFSTLHISGSGLGLMIGRRGQTLDALQYLANIVANRYSDNYVRIVLDAENFRERRKKTLEDLADRLAGRAVKTRKEIVLEPMPASERKVIHFRLQNHAQVKTFSKGEEPNRRIVITLKQQ
ncbi:MAG: RNA-binding cell elongation regulator Jag/EloR [Bacillota bacterium]